MAVCTTLGIISLGDMGVGMAKLLKAHGFSVLTTTENRSEATRQRAASVDVQVLSTEKSLVEASDVILSIVPPDYAYPLAERICSAIRTGAENKAICYLDINAISPSTARSIEKLIEPLSNVTFIDGGIIGGPPKRKPDSKDGDWVRPSVVVSGPQTLADAVPDGQRLSDVLRIKHITNTIGPASGLKMCFASMSKGFTALAIQSFTTAHRLGVLDELRTQLSEFNPEAGRRAESSLVTMPPKAYRWIGEMEEIAATFRHDGGFESTLFDEIAKVYDVIAHQTLLGSEKTENRIRGTTADDVAALTAEGLRSRQQQ